MITPTYEITRCSLRRAIETMRSQMPGLTEGEAGFHAACALMVGAYVEVLSGGASTEEAALLTQLLNFVLEAGQQLSGPDFNKRAEELRNANNN